MSARIRVVIADDQAIVREGLATVLSLLPDVEVVGEAADGAQACALVSARQPDVVLMDLRMPVLDGVQATARIAAEHPGVAVLVLTTYADDASVVGALRAGARGYLTKDADREDVAAAVRSVAHGNTTLGPRAGAVVREGIDARARGAGAGVRPADAGSWNVGAGVGSAGAAATTGVPEPGHTSGALRAPAAGHTPDAATRLRSRFPALTPREAEVLALVADGLSNAEIATALYVGIPTVKTHINAIFAKIGVRDRARAIALVRA